MIMINETMFSLSLYIYLDQFNSQIMKRQLFISFCLFFVFQSSLAQNTLILTPNTSYTSADNNVYYNFQDAHDGASDGDIIQVHPGDYGDVTISKPLTIIGTGYNLSDNPNTQANKSPSVFGLITFDMGSEGSSITGLKIDEGLYITTNNIIIIRNHTKYIRLNNANNILISENYISSYYGGIGSSSSGRGAIYLEGDTPNLIIRNNYISGAGGSSGYSSILCKNCTSAGMIYNNILAGSTYSVSNYVIKNNIFISNIVYNGTGNTVMNNIFGNNSTGAGNGIDNVTGQDMSEVFVGYPDITGYNTENRFTLKADSPAIGAGENGVDCGIYGGDTPYIPSGIPSGPHIYSLTIPSNTGGSIPLGFGAKTQK